MRRGLMRWDEGELPLGVFEQRMQRLRTAMRTAGLDALVLYTNLVRPSGVHYLTGFTPYWSEGLLLVGRDGPPVFATALSKRVAEWIRSVSPVGDIVNTPQPGTVLGQRIAADPSVRRVGVLELDAFPAGSYEEMSAAAPGREFVDATALFAELRRKTDAAERRLLARADAIAVAALQEVDAADAADAGAVAGAVEKRARLEGAEEAYIAVAPDLATERRMIRTAPSLALKDMFALRVSVAYKGNWVRRTRTFARDGGARQDLSRAEKWFASLIASLPAETALAEQIEAEVQQLPGARLVSFMAEGAIGSYPLQVIAASNAPPSRRLGDFLVLTVELVIDGRPWLGAAPALVGNASLT